VLPNPGLAKACTWSITNSACFSQGFQGPSLAVVGRIGNRRLVSGVEHTAAQHAANVVVRKWRAWSFGAWVDFGVLVWLFSSAMEGNDEGGIN